ncbi:methionyl-tRNA formyltransferase [Propionivibrio dicarboxylicus]|uniref:Methionyl-tRNA formyltransferase n=1 Tax=Propionivibrio dicarboxylicus TaxID=83767 RepID=A0A1G7W7X9_9RHOO|nr:methionyl-tRNA formyltransferase [Propionivibrio dicarboxylicus]SDG68105.1 methionyl-tRNA formyltransferase [Propionivibrio dicarboxylicus]
MKLIFAGTPVFAAQALEALIAAGHELVLVLTQPDRPAGRGLSLQPSAVKQVAQAHGIEVFQPNSLRDTESQARVSAVGADLMVVAAYGLILPQAVLDMPRLGCVNIHASLLPRWRGAAPIQRAILAGDRETGVCIMQMEAGLDTGPVLLSEALTIEDEDTSASLHDRLADLGARLIVDAVASLPLSPRPQPEVGITYAAKIEKREAALDWHQPAEALDRHIRAFNPFPGAVASLNGQPVKVWRAYRVAGQGTPGEILAVGKDGISVACGDGVLCLLEVQKAGGKRMSAAQFAAGGTILAGASFDLTPAT